MRRFENNTAETAAKRTPPPPGHARRLRAASPATTGAAAQPSGEDLESALLSGCAGGALLINGSSSSLALDGSVVIGNRAPFGAAIAVAASASAAVTAAAGSAFLSNEASIAGGLLFATADTALLVAGSRTSDSAPPAAGYSDVPPVLPTFVEVANGLPWLPPCGGDSPPHSFSASGCSNGNRAGLWGPIAAVGTLRVDAEAVVGGTAGAATIAAGGSLPGRATIRDAFGQAVLSLPGSRISAVYPGMPDAAARCALGCFRADSQPCRRYVLLLARRRFSSSHSAPSPIPLMPPQARCPRRIHVFGSEPIFLGASARPARESRDSHRHRHRRAAGRRAHLADNQHCASGECCLILWANPPGAISLEASLSNSFLSIPSFFVTVEQPRENLRLSAPPQPPRTVPAAVVSLSTSSRNTFLFAVRPLPTESPPTLSSNHAGVQPVNGGVRVCLR